MGITALDATMLTAITLVVPAVIWPIIARPPQPLRRGRVEGLLFPGHQVVHGPFTEPNDQRR
jgi:hypothetical protein